MAMLNFQSVSFDLFNNNEMDRVLHLHNIKIGTHNAHSGVFQYVVWRKRYSNI